MKYIVIIHNAKEIYIKINQFYISQCSELNVWYKNAIKNK